MTAELLLVDRYLIEHSRDTLDDALQHYQRQPLARQAVGRGRNRLTGQMQQMYAGGIAMEHLLDEEVNRRDGIEDALAPAMLMLVTRLADGFGCEQLCQIALDPLQGLRDSNHPWPPCDAVVVKQTTSLREAIFCASVLNTCCQTTYVIVLKLMPFRHLSY